MPVSFSPLPKSPAANSTSKSRKSPPPVNGKRKISSIHGPAVDHNTGSRKRPKTSRGGRKCKTCRRR